MRIGMILDEAYPPDPRVEGEARALRSIGHEIFLLAYPSNQANPSEFPSWLNVEYFETSQWVRKKLSALAYTIPLYHMKWKFRITQFIEEHNISILYVHDIRVARAVFWGNKGKLPIVLDLHENRPEIMKFYNHIQSIVGRGLIYPGIWKKFERKYMRLSSLNIVVTEAAKEYYIENFSIEPHKIHVIPNAVDEEFIAKAHAINYPAQNSKVVIIYIGDTGERRGTADLIQCVEHFPKDLQDRIELRILGLSSFQPELESMVSRKRLGSIVKLLGWQNYKGIHRHLSESHIGVCPLHWNVHHDTTYANKLFQYMAYGLPVVASDCQSQAELLIKEGCGLVHVPGSPSDIAEKILNLISNPSLFRRLSENGFKAVRKGYSTEVQRKKFKAICKVLIEN